MRSAIILAALIASAPAEGQPPELDLKEIAGRYIDAQEAVMEANAGPTQVDALMAFYADNYVYHHPEAGASIRDRDAMRRGISSHLGETTDPSITVLEASVNGEIVGLATVQSFTIRATNERVERSGYTLLRIRNGKIVTRIDM